MVDPEPAPAQEVLNEQGEIFSCGGVYLGLNRPSIPLTDRFDFLHLPNRHKGVLTLNHQKVHRLPGEVLNEGLMPHQERLSTEETLRRFFKENLN
jgi:hypothetical protein